MTETGRGLRPDPDALIHKRGSLADMVSELRERAEYLEHTGGSRAKIDRVAEAINSLETGAFSVRVGVTTYTVEGEPASTIPHPASEADVS